MEEREESEWGEELYKREQKKGSRRFSRDGDGGDENEVGGLKYDKSRNLYTRVNLVSAGQGKQRETEDKRPTSHEAAEAAVVFVAIPVALVLCSFPFLEIS